MNKRNKRTLIASTAAALFALGAAGSALADNHGGASEDAKVKCEGGNACKGQGDCHTAGQDCAGKNACKGKGWVHLTPEECKAAGGTLASE